MSDSTSVAAPETPSIRWIPKEREAVDIVAERQKRVEAYARMLAIATRERPPKSGYHARPVRVVELEMNFATVGAAAAELGMPSALIRNALRTGGATGGMHFVHAGDPERFLSKCEVPVRCSDGRVFGNASEAIRAVGVARSTFFDALNHGRPVKGLLFVRLDGRAEPPQAAIPKRKPGRPVIRVDDGVTFDSARTAALAIGVTPSSITGAIRYGKGRCGGYRWRYADDATVSAAPDAATVHPWRRRSA